MRNAYCLSEQRERQAEKVHLSQLFELYLPKLHNNCQKMFRFITPISGICHVQLLCSLLSSLLVPHNVPADAAYEQYEMFFVFAVKFMLKVQTRLYVATAIRATGW